MIIKRDVLIAMITYTIIKMTALICATAVLLHGMVWQGIALFVLACLLRMEFKFIPDKPEETQ